MKPLKAGLQRHLMKIAGIQWAEYRKTEDTNMKYVITLFQDEDGVFIAECPSIPGCVSQGKTESEAEINICQAIKECLDVREAKGRSLMVSICQVEVAV